MCDSHINSIEDASNFGLQHIYIDKDDEFLVDHSLFDHNLTIVINSPIASFVLEHANTVMPYGEDGDTSLLIFELGDSNAWITVYHIIIIFISDYNNKITFKVNENINVIVPENQLSEKTIDFKFDLTFDFPEGSSYSLNTKSVDNSGNVSLASLSDVESYPPMKYQGEPSNLETLGSFFSDAIDSLKEENASNGDGIGSAGSAAITIGVSLFSILGILALIIAMLVRASKKKKALKVDQILEIQ
jgi:hypothetical protein